MPRTFTTLGHVLLHIYQFDFGGGIYLPDVMRFESDTPCIIAMPATTLEAEEAILHQLCLDDGFRNWLNVAVVTDTCDGAVQTESSLIAAFNEDCREGGWLRKMMNYRKSSSVPDPRV